MRIKITVCMSDHVRNIVLFIEEKRKTMETNVTEKGKVLLP